MNMNQYNKPTFNLQGRGESPIMESLVSRTSCFLLKCQIQDKIIHASEVPTQITNNSLSMLQKHALGTFGF